jgi:hypothetical protein
MQVQIAVSNAELDAPPGVLMLRVVESHTGGRLLFPRMV